jgi:hypothetical protein
MFLLLVTALSAQQQTVTPAEREARWREDFNAMSAGLKARGIRIAGGIATRGQKDFAILYPKFDSEMEALHSEVATLSDAEIVLRLMRLIASAGVAHNHVSMPLGMGFLYALPFNVHWFADGLAVTAATPEYSEALGARVVSIGGVKVEQFLADLAPYIPHENDTELRNGAPGLMISRGALDHFHMVGDDRRVTVQLERPGGDALTLTVPLVIRNAEKIGVEKALQIPAPLYRTHREQRYYWHQYLPDAQTLYIQYNTCTNDPQKHFGDFVNDVFADADAHTVKRVVIDLRNNGGGNERVIGPLKSALSERRSKVGPIYVLIGPATFSSAVSNAEQLHHSLGATLVGENSGGMPGGYGEVSTVTLPNSKLVVQFTTKRGDTAGPKTLTPEVLAPLRIRNFLDGRDPALEAAIRGR